MAKYSVEAVDIELINASCVVRNVREVLARNRGRGLKTWEACDANSPRLDSLLTRSKISNSPSYSNLYSLHNVCAYPKENRPASPTLFRHSTGIEF
jgi:hypothetical protein